VSLVDNLVVSHLQSHQESPVVSHPAYQLDSLVGNPVSFRQACQLASHPVCQLVSPVDNLVVSRLLYQLESPVDNLVVSRIVRQRDSHHRPPPCNFDIFSSNLLEIPEQSMLVLSPWTTTGAL
jgi:hypothetical protein